MSPTLATILFVSAGLWLATLAVIAAYFFRRLQNQERLKAIERGVDLSFDPPAAAAGSRRAGIVFVSLGVGIAVGDGVIAAVSRDPEAFVGLALAVIPFFVGVGLLIDYRLARKDVK